MRQAIPLASANGHPLVIRGPYSVSRAPMYWPTLRHGVGGMGCPSCLLALAGMGATTAQEVSAGTQAAVGVANAAKSNLPTSTKAETAAASALFSAAAVPSPATPFLAIAGGVATLLAAVGVGSGCGQDCITASDYANKAEGLLKQNLDTYLALETPRAKSAQTAGVANFNSIWNGLEQACGAVPGDAGKNCVSDRQAGACKWTNAAGCFNWFTGYLYPISQDQNTYDDSAQQYADATSSAVSGVATGLGLTTTQLLVAAAAVFVVVKMWGGGK